MRTRSRFFNAAPKVLLIRREQRAVPGDSTNIHPKRRGFSAMSINRTLIARSLHHAV